MHGREEDVRKCPAYTRESGYFGYNPYENHHDVHGCCLEQCLLFEDLSNPTELGANIPPFLCFISFVRIDLALVG
jgi:hypothetical protein